MNSLSHTKWRCKYHIVYVPKYRRHVIYEYLRKEIGSIPVELCSRRGIFMFIGGRDSEYKATYPQNHAIYFNPDKRL